jgi:uncharacterized membrane-anchored protein
VLPDVNAKWTILGGSVTTIVVWIVSASANVEVPPEVSSAATVVIAAIVGALAGDNSMQRRSTDPGNGGAK